MRLFAIGSLGRLCHKNHVSEAATMMKDVLGVGPILRMSGSKGLATVKGIHNHGGSLRRLMGLVSRGVNDCRSAYRAVFVDRNSYRRSTGCITRGMGRGCRVGAVVVGRMKTAVNTRSNPKAVTLFFIKSREWVDFFYGVIS